MVLGKDRDDGDAGVAADDGDVLGGDVGAVLLGDESLGPDDVKSGDAEDLVLSDTKLLVDLAGDGHGGVDWVGDDTDPSVGAVLGTSLGQGGDDGGVGVEEVVPGHTGLPGDAGGDDDDVHAGEAVSQLVGALEAGDSGRGVAVGEISGDAGGADDVEEVELLDLGVLLHEQGQGQ